MFLKKDFKKLISNLNNNDWRIRYDAVLTLCERKHRVAIRHLMKVFKDRSGQIIVKPRDGSGEGYDTGYNINDF